MKSNSNVFPFKFALRLLFFFPKSTSGILKNGKINIFTDLFSTSRNYQSSLQHISTWSKLSRAHENIFIKRDTWGAQLTASGTIISFEENSLLEKVWLWRQSWGSTGLPYLEFLCSWPNYLISPVCFLYITQGE